MFNMEMIIDTHRPLLNISEHVMKKRKDD